MNIRGLLGAFQQQPDQLQSLLGEYYDPRTAKMKWLGGTLQGFGMGLASGQPGAWATGLAQGGGQALDDYRKDAQQGYMLAQAKQDQDWQAKERARKESEWAKADASTAQMNALIGKLPENERVYAQLAPEAWVKGKLNPGGEAGGYYGVPLPYIRTDGSVGYGLPSKSGSFAELPTPPNAKFLSPGEISGQKAQGAAEGKAVGEARGDLPGAIKQAETTTLKIDRLAADPALDSAIGYTSYLPNAVVPSSVISFRGKVDELMGGAFLEARTVLKGGGQITDFESGRAEKAYARMETAIQSSNPKDFKDALADFKQAIADGLAKLSATARMPEAPAANSGNTRYKYNAKTGELE